VGDGVGTGEKREREGMGMGERVLRGCVGGDDFHGVMGGAPLWWLTLRGGETDDTSRQVGAEVNGRAALSKERVEKKERNIGQIRREEVGGGGSGSDKEECKVHRFALKRERQGKFR